MCITMPALYMSFLHSAFAAFEHSCCLMYSRLDFVKPALMSVCNYLASLQLSNASSEILEG